MRRRAQYFTRVHGQKALPFSSRTSKWNKIEHRMFCFISRNWRGRPLISVETVIDLITNTATSKGLKIVCVEDNNKYEPGIKVSDKAPRRRPEKKML
jgi:hypothetical protein